ncbi:MAG: HAMP domain-containing sensor histidine kinase, partial [Chlamydiota bacterium]|nr:HAMP domain-containing sensor histidine kinase [Chlamydiota bacterium]
MEFVKTPFMAKDTDPTKQELTAKKVDQLKADFISAVSHELRTPLSIIKEAISLVNDQIVGKLTKEQMDILNIAIANTRRLERLVHDLLDLSRLESGRAKLHMKRVSPISLIDEAVRHFQKKAQDQGKVIDIHMPQDLPDMYADEDTMMQVLNNLIDNAVTYSNRA